MKTLYESILNDVEKTIIDGDKYVNREKELKSLRTLKPSNFKKIYVTDKHRLKNYDINACEVYKYVWSCPGIVYNLEQNKHDNHEIMFIIILVKSKSTKEWSYNVYTLLSNDNWPTKYDAYRMNLSAEQNHGNWKTKQEAISAFIKVLNNIDEKQITNIFNSNPVNASNICQWGIPNINIIENL